MTQERLHFLISQYIDGTLSPSELEVVERALAEDAEARRVYQEYRTLSARLAGLGKPAVNYERLAERISGSIYAGPADVAAEHALAAEGAAIGESDESTLTDLLRAADPLPEIKWDVLAGMISSAVDRQGAVQAQLDEIAELAIVQYVDGELPEVEAAALEARLQQDPAGRQALNEHLTLERILKSQGGLENIDFAMLTSHISEAVEDEAMRQRYSIARYLHQGARVALAACILIVAGAVIRSVMRTGDVGQPLKLAEITIADMAPATGTPITEVSFSGPADGALADGRFAGFDTVVSGRPARLEIAMWGDLPDWP